MPPKVTPILSWPCHAYRATLTTKVAHILERSTLSELNGYILDELEQLHGEAPVRVVLCSICLSRFGIAATELEQLLSDDAAGAIWPKRPSATAPPFNPSTFYALILGFGRFLNTADGLLNIRGMGMIHAVRDKYLGLSGPEVSGRGAKQSAAPPKDGGANASLANQAKRMRLLMIGFFMRKLYKGDPSSAGTGSAPQSSWLPVGPLGIRRVCDELPQLLVDANEPDLLQRLLLDPRVFEALWTRRQADLFAYWRFCGGGDDDGKVPAATGRLYVEMIEAFEGESAEMCQMLGDFLVQCAFFSESRFMFHRAYQLVHDGVSNDEKSEAVAAAHVRLAHAYHLEGTDLAKASEHMKAGIGIHEYIMSNAEDAESKEETKLRLTREVYLPFTQLKIDSGEADEAERLCRLSLREQQRMNGFEHPDTALAHGMLGQALVAQDSGGQANQEAVNHLELAISISEKSYGDVSYVTVTGLLSLGSLYIKEFEAVRHKVSKLSGGGETHWLDDARQRLLKALKGGEDIYGKVSKQAADSLEKLALVKLYKDEMEINEQRASVDAGGAPSAAAASSSSQRSHGAAPAGTPTAAPVRNQKSGGSSNAPAMSAGAPEPAAKAVTAAVDPSDWSSRSSGRAGGGSSGGARAYVPLAEDNELLSDSLRMLNKALSFRVALQGSQHRDVASCHLRLADHHWLHRDLPNVVRELKISHDIHMHIAEEIDMTGSREIGKIKSLLVVALVHMDELDQAHRYAMDAKEMVH